MTPLNVDQLFRELDAIKASLTDIHGLVTLQNGRVRTLETKMAIVWWALSVVGLFTLYTVAPAVYAALFAK